MTVVIVVVGGRHRALSPSTNVDAVAVGHDLFPVSHGAGGEDADGVFGCAAGGDVVDGAVTVEEVAS